MSRLNRIQLSSLATAFAIFAFSVAPGLTDEIATDEMANLGPVGADVPILTTVASKRIVAFYSPVSGRCAVQMVIGDIRDPEAALVSRIRVDLEPGQMVHLDAVEQKSLNVKSLDLECGENAEKLAIVGNHVSSAQQEERVIQATASGF